MQAPKAAAPALTAGIARRIITPTRPVFLSGYARSAKSDGVYQQLHARALVLTDATGYRLALLTAELLDFSESLVNTIKAGVGARLGLSAEQVLLSASHTHCGPVVDDEISNLYPEVDREYVAWLGQACVETICEAAAGPAVPVTVQFGTSRAAFGVNRRRPDLPGCPMSPNPGGRSDPEVAILRFAAANGDVVALLFSYACHATVMGGQFIGGDYPGQAQLALELQFPGANAMFLAGCFGDVRPRIINAKGGFAGGILDDVRALGRELAWAVMAGLSGPLQEVTGSLAAGLETVQLPYREHLSEAELEAKARGTDGEAKWAQEVLRRWRRDGSLPRSRPSTVQVFGIGPFRLVAFNDEMCVGYQLMVKRDLAPAPALVAAYCGCSRSYVPTADLIPEGGYEAYSNIWPYLEPAPLAPEVEPILLGAALRLARGLRPQP